MKKWEIAALDKENAGRISKQFNIHILPSMLLDVMNFESDEEIEDFLSNDCDFSDPYLITDMDKAVERISKAVNSFESVCVYGDYDADGVTSTAMLYSYLCESGANVVYYIPSRDTEGYGLNNAAIEKLKESGVTLLITVDNGISACGQVDFANALGIDVIITDHHTPPEILPNAKAVVNPHRKDDISPFKDFSGVGVVFKLIMALEDETLDIDELADKYSDIAALGTIGDVVSLTGENRKLVKAGLYNINSYHNTGIQALRECSGNKNKEMSAMNVAFTLVPRLNAVGRLGLSQKSVQLLLSDDKAEADLIANELNEDNRSRQEIEQQILESIEDALLADESLKLRRVIVIAGEGWHQGVIGIAAARIKDRYGKPTVIITYDGDSAKGSARSIEGFSMCDAVAYCKDLLTVYGGHPMAAGMSLPKENIDAFREKINEFAYSMEYIPFPTVKIVCKLNPAVLSVDMVESLEILEPYGSGNPTPVFGLYNLTLSGIYPVSGGKHLRLVFRRGNCELSAMYFGMTQERFPYIPGDVLNLAVTLSVNEYNCTKNVSVFIKEISFSNLDLEKLMNSNVMYEDLRMGRPTDSTVKKELSVTREECASVYRFLKANGGFAYDKEILYRRLNNSSISMGKLMVILRAMQELKLITMNSTSNMLNIKVVNNPSKVNLLSAPILKDLL